MIEGTTSWDLVVKGTVHPHTAKDRCYPQKNFNKSENNVGKKSHNIHTK